MGERWKKTLDKLMQSRRVVDASVSAFPKLKEITPDMARKSIRRDQDLALEQSIEAARLGKRTFPSATQIGGTPMLPSAEALNAETERKRLKKAQPFFTDPGSGEVDFNMPPHPFVMPVPSSSTLEHALQDKALFPASVPENTGWLSGLIQRLGLKP